MITAREYWLRGGGFEPPTFGLWAQRQETIGDIRWQLVPILLPRF